MKQLWSGSLFKLQLLHHHIQIFWAGPGPLCQADKAVSVLHRGRPAQRSSPGIGACDISTVIYIVLCHEDFLSTKQTTAQIQVNIQMRTPWSHSCLLLHSGNNHVVILRGLTAFVLWVWSLFPLFESGMCSQGGCDVTIVLQLDINECAASMCILYISSLLFDQDAVASSVLPSTVVRLGPEA